MPAKRALYPGSFDPVTFGHLDVIRRGARLFDELYVAVAVNTSKRGFFSAEERVALLTEAAGDLPNVTIDVFEGMTVEYAGRIGAGVILRGIRSVSDFENEYRLAQTNRALAPGIETVIVLASLEKSFLSANYILEAARLGGDVAPFVPPCVKAAITAKLAE